MINIPIWSKNQLIDLPVDSTVVSVTPSCRDWAVKQFPFRVLGPVESASHQQTVIAVGGGQWLDEWKFKQPEHGFRLVCIPSLFGSGAEVSPVVVINTPEGKKIEMGQQFKPFARAYFPELLQGVAPERAQDACGDVWSHAVEAFMSPLADEPLRAEASELINDLLLAPWASTPDGLI